MKSCALLLCLSWLAAAGILDGDEAILIPAAAAAPTIDGRLDDACWEQALCLSDFTLPMSAEVPVKRTTVLVSSDAAGLYFGFDCDEPEPAAMRLTGHEEDPDLWQDDCIEIFLRTTTNNREYFQFIANAAGKRRTLRLVPGAAGMETPAWQVQTVISADRWTCEVMIPFAEIGRAAPRPGDMLQLKVGREGRAGREGQHAAIWPAGARYGGPDDLAPVYVVTDNMLANPAMQADEAGKIAGWSFGENDRELFAAADDSFIFKAPGRYATASCTLRLTPGAGYELTALVKTGVPIYLRARVAEQPGEASIPFTVTAPVSASFTPVRLLFRGTAAGEALIIIGGTEDAGAGMAQVKDLKIRRVPFFREAGDPIPVAAGVKMIVRDVPITDIRALRGFVGGAADGMTDTRGWNGGPWEYNSDRNNTGVLYDYHGNDGLNVTLGDPEGFNAVVIRGGIRAEMYADCPHYDRPEGGRKIGVFNGGSRNSRAFYRKTVKTQQVSFFNVNDGLMADVSFLRVLAAFEADGPVITMTASGPAEAADVEMLCGRRFKVERTAYACAAGAAPAAVSVGEDGIVHLVTEPLAAETAVTAVELVAEVTGVPLNAPFSIRVQDPADPRRELAGADFVLAGPGLLDLVMDVSDRIVPAETRFWVTLIFPAGASLGAAGDGCRLALHTVSRSTALPEARRDALFLMKTYFAGMSEARPWMGWGSYEKMKESFDHPEYGFQLHQIADQLAYCRYLDAADPVINQYYEWLMRSNMVWKKANNRWHALDASHARIDEVPGAPEWAVVARQAWLEARTVPQWWLDNRLVATGEFGGVVGDDTDMYQNYVGLPFFEEGGTAAAAKEAARRLYVLADEITMDRGLNRHTMDPLHAYEEGINHLGLMWLWNYGDPVYFEECMTSAASAVQITTMTPEGHRHFRNQDMGSADLRFERELGQDGHAHALIWHPALDVVRYNRNPRLLKVLEEWADGWLAHMEPGVYAVMVDVASEKVTETTRTPLYGAYGGQGSAFEDLFLASGDTRYLAPFVEAFNAVSLNTAPSGILAELIHAGGITELEALDELVRKDPFAAWTIHGEKGGLINALKMDIAEIQNYRHMYTAAEVFTDRVFLYGLINPSKAYTGGYATRNKFSWTYGVRYAGFGTDYAALVRETSPSAFRVLLYNFAEAPLTGTLTLLALDNGLYRVQQGIDSDGDDLADQPGRDEELVLHRGAELAVTLAPGKITVLEIIQVRPLDDLRLRADLALSPLEIKVTGGKVAGRVHNIGSRSADAVVALVTADGTVLQEKALGNIEAPLDLKPRTIDFEFGPLPAAGEVFVVVDPAGRVAEILETNNRVRVER